MNANIGWPMSEGHDPATSRTEQGGPPLSENARLESERVHGDLAGPIEGEAEQRDHIARLFSQHNRALVGYLKARLRSEQEAIEVAQEAYVRVLQLDKPGGSGLLRAYLFKTAANLAVDRLRRRSLLQRIEENELFTELNTPNGDSNNPEQRLLKEETERQLWRFLDELPEKCRQIFRLCRLDGLSQQDVAMKLGVSDRMVRRYVTYVVVYCRLRIGGASAQEAGERVKL